ncbi:hypothetical protein MKW98_007361 [Papaver atlanticum]|uniref:Nucleotide-diphospho-sugar transferase domain-containing protein n=1 Tax=Papaver atlanticum TaxID=357466 RepID=A0AAD4XCT0_9MAGN|nr:hypothetical protein MKW98_007361 [Papaver atlanticum]
MGHFKNVVRNLVVPSIFIIGLICILFWTPDISTRISSFQYYQQCDLVSNEIAATARFALSPQDELETALSEASAGNNKTVIIAIINKAYVEGEMTMLSVFLQSFWLGEDTRYLINHLLLVSVDQVSYERCKFLRLHCYRLVTEGVDFGREKLYNSQEFKKMMWRRTEFLADVLRRGYSFIFTDADVMWLRDPLKVLRNQDLNQTDDIQMSCDCFNGDPWSGFNSKQLNTGFYYVRSTNNTIALFNTWYKMKEDPHFNAKKDQDALKVLFNWGVLRNLKIRWLDTLYFSGFCQDSKDIKVVSTVHANCCRSINAKFIDLMSVLTEWKKFRDGVPPINSVNETIWSPHLECGNSWKRKIKV